MQSTNVRKASLSSFLFLCPKTVPNKSDFFFFPVALLMFWTETLQLRLQAEMLTMGVLRPKIMACVCDGMVDLEPTGRSISLTSC